MPVDGRTPRSAFAGCFGEHRCAFCFAPAFDAGLCHGCIDALPWNAPACVRCAMPLPREDAHCRRCSARTPPWASAFCPLIYAPPVSNWLWSLKYHADLPAARRLGMLLADAVRAAELPLPEVLIPVPLHAARLRERGYNQACEIARHLGRRLHLAVDVRCVQRTRPTADQIGLTALERRRNLRGAFSVDAHRLAGRSVVLIDDVMTTGATCEALTTTLQRAGAGRVQVWCPARAP